MFEREEWHPQAELLRHAQLRAAVHNGQVPRRDRKFWTSNHFLSADPWVAAAPPAKRVPTAAEIAVQVAALNQTRRK